MIVPMKKVSLVVLDSSKKESLKTLRKLGVVHLETIEGDSAALSAFKESSSETDKAISILEEIKLNKKELPVQEKLSKEEACSKAKEILALSDRKKSYFDSINQDTQELSRLELWGTVNPDDLQELAQKGIFAYLYEIPSEKYSLIGEDCRTIVVNSVNKITRFLLLSDTAIEEKPASLPPEAYAVPLPRASTEVIADDIRKAHQGIVRIDGEIKAAKKYTKALKDYKKELASDIEFENVYSGMAHEEGESDSAKLAWLTGYVPEDLMEKFKAACSENGWAYAASTPSQEDYVPTKLKNNKLVSLIYPLTDFLDVTPGYNEYDISSWFLLFFCIFFAMIFGDAAYGALILLLGLGLMFKGMKAGKAGASINLLVVLLGFSTMVWGVMTCSWFGIAGDKLPEQLINMSCMPFSKYKYALANGLPFDSAVAEDYANLNQKVFCFVLALVQLSIAHIKGIISNRKTLKAIGELGSLLELWGMFYIVMAMVGNPEEFPLGVVEGKTIMIASVIPLPYLCIGVLLFGFALSFVFSNYNGSIKESVLESCKNIISVLLGIVNVFSDMVSYIRLWAVALAGAAISGTINEMAGPMIGKFSMIIFVVVLLVFGHGLNLMLNLLSVIVHGVRLNTLEFSSHLGMSWSGIKYRPFSEK